MVGVVPLKHVVFFPQYFVEIARFPSKKTPSPRLKSALATGDLKVAKIRYEKKVDLTEWYLDVSLEVRING